MINPLPEYCEEIENIEDIIYDVDLIDVSEKEEVFFKELAEKIGTIIICFNALERDIDECLLELMNDRCEDPKIWILIKDFSFDKKTTCLKQIYAEMLNHIDNTTDLSSKINILFNKITELKVFRNLIAHCNWVNHSNLNYFETKVKFVSSKNKVCRIRKELTLHDLDNSIEKMNTTRDELYELNTEIIMKIFN